MIRLRKLIDRDLHQIQRIHAQFCDFPFPNLKSSVYKAKRLICVDEELVGMGALKLTSEAILVLDLEKSRFQKALILKELIKELSRELESLKLEDVHVFTLGPECVQLAKVLEHLGFQRCSGIPMVGVTNGKKGNGAS